VTDTPIAKAYVTIAPDLDYFRPELAAGLSAAMAGVAPTVPITADTALADAKMAAVRAAASGLGTMRVAPTIDANNAPAVATVAATETALTALGDEVFHPTIAPVVDWGSLGSLDAAMADLSSTPPDTSAAALYALSTMGGSGGGAALAAALAAGAGGDGGKGGGTGGLVSGLLMGGGAAGIFGLGAGLPALGSIGAFAGLGPEHVLMTLLGLGGSLGGGLIGGGLLAAGAAGQMGVGMGSDAAVMSSTLADTKALYTAYENLQQAVLQYGAGSTQATAAQSALNVQMALLGNTAGVQAEMGLAKATDALNTFWDQATSTARIFAVSIMQQVLNLGADYIPQIAAAASRNLAIINESLTPLLQWLEGPQGLGIFTDLENRFAAQLPTAMHAFDQAVELVMKTVDAAAQYTGNFVKALDVFVTKWNSPPNFAIWDTEIGKLIGDFRLWWDLVKAVGTDIYRLFNNDVGTGAAIVQTITAMLQKLGEWEASVAGRAQLHDIFQTHKQEVLDLLQLLPPLLSSFGRIELVLAPALTGALTDVLQLVLPFVQVLSSFAPTAFLLGITAILAKLGALGPIFAWMKPAFAMMVLGFQTGAGAVESFRAALLSLDFNPFILAITAVGAASVAAFQAWKSATAGIKQNIDALAPTLNNPAILIGGPLQAGLAGLSEKIIAMNTNLAELQRVKLTGSDPVSNMIVSGSVTQAVAALNEKIQETWQQIRNWNDNTSYFVQNLHVSSQAVNDLATAAGVNLAKSLNPTAIDKMNQELASLATAAGVSGPALSAMAATTNQSVVTMSDEISKAVGQVQQSFAAATNVVQAFSGSTIPATAANISSWYKTTVSQAQQWAANINTAIRDGYNPALIDQILQQGPQTAGPLLQGIVNDYSASFVSMVNANQAALQSISQTAIEQARLMQVAIHASNSAVSADYSSAMALDQQILASGGQALSTSFIQSFSGGIPAMVQVANEYGIALPDAVKAQLGITGQVGSYQVNSLAKGMAQGAPQPNGIALQLVNQIGQVFLNGGWVQIGNDIVGGIAQGITDTNLLSDALLGAVKNAQGQVTGYLETGSPSRLMARIVGLPIAQGVAAGILEGLPTVAGAVNALTAATMPAIGPDSILTGDWAALGTSSSGGGDTFHVHPGAVVINGADLSNPEAVHAAVTTAVQKLATGLQPRRIR